MVRESWPLALLKDGVSVAILALSFSLQVCLSPAWLTLDYNDHLYWQLLLGLCEEHHPWPRFPVLHGQATFLLPISCLPSDLTLEAMV